MRSLHQLEVQQFPPGCCPVVLLISIQPSAIRSICISLNNRRLALRSAFFADFSSRSHFISLRNHTQSFSATVPIVPALKVCLFKDNLCVGMSLTLVFIGEVKDQYQARCFLETRKSRTEYQIPSY